jgi:hypothetical protein
MVVNIETARTKVCRTANASDARCAADECMPPVNQVTGKRLPADQRRGYCGFAGPIQLREAES